ncbi:hypothetical protein [Alkaliphilus transvaalensis]|uniref:hypothetical protein n=1 Tax=Alkaliphilus transvaalensis TaxID=114628 RepID=UPI0012EBA0A0|nr:hypothetical protein [Alkaliphilus transvaalensis]
MKKRIGDYIQDIKRRNFTEMHLHDFLEMKDAGLTDSEMAEEFGVSQKVIESLRKDFKE